MPTFQLFNAAQIDSLRKGGKILRECLTMLRGEVRPGITTASLDALAEKFILSYPGARPAFIGYQGYKATLCTSVNEECVHAPPSKRVINDGDIISLDCGVLFDDLYTDACITVGVGKISPDAQKLITVTEEALTNALAQVRAGARVGDVSAAVERTVRPHGFAPVRILTGHGLGTTLHQFPDIPNWGTAGTGAVFPANTIVAIEPIISAGSDAVREGKDGWTLSTKDGALCAHSEHTVLITEERCEVLA